MFDKEILKIVSDGAEEVIVKKGGSRLHYMLVENSILKIDKNTGIVLNELKIE
jgi:hypothetical protein